MRIFSTFALAGLIAGATPACATCTLGKAATLKLTIEKSRLYVPVSINETEGQFLVDTGSEDTLLSAAYAARAHVGIDTHAPQKIYSGVGDRQTLRVFQAHARHIQVDDISFQDWLFSVVPMEEGDLGRDERDGILGMDFLHYFDLDFDLQGHTLTLWRLSSECKDIHPEWHGDYDAIPLKHTAHQNAAIPVQVDNALLDMEFDTGAGGVLLTRDAASKAGVTDAMLLHDRNPALAGLGGKFPSVLHRFQMLLVGNAEIDHPTIDIETESHRTAYADGLISWEYLKAGKFWISYATNTLFVQLAGKL